MKILAFPRVELHVHLDGSIDSEDLFEICKARNLTLPTGLPQNTSDVQHYVEGFSGWHRFDAVNEIIGGDVASIRKAAEAFVDFQAKSGVQYTEVRYDPVRLSRSRLGNVSISEEDAVKAVQEGLMIGSRRHKIHVYQILCAMRGASPQQCFSTANLALKLASQDLGGVVGLDLAGDETDFPNAAYVDCMRHAKLAGLNVTVHSGEFNTSQTSDVRSAVFSMLADRVGHGYAAAQDVELLRELTRRGIHLEACPNSAKRHGAWALKAIESFREHHALFGLNTDDPAPLFGNTTAAADEDIVEGLHIQRGHSPILCSCLSCTFWSKSNERCDKFGAAKHLCLRPKSDPAKEYHQKEKQRFDVDVCFLLQSFFYVYIILFQIGDCRIVVALLVKLDLSGFSAAPLLFSDSSASTFPCACRSSWPRA